MQRFVKAWLLHVAYQVPLGVTFDFEAKDKGLHSVL